MSRAQKSPLTAADLAEAARVRGEAMLDHAKSEGHHDGKAGTFNDRRFYNTEMQAVYAAAFNAARAS